jgi:hypothetical protein
VLSYQNLLQIDENGLQVSILVESLYANLKKRKKENNDKLHARVRSQTKGVQVEDKKPSLGTQTE